MKSKKVDGRKGEIIVALDTADRKRAEHLVGQLKEVVSFFKVGPILFTVAAFYLPNLPQGIFDQAMALPYHLYIISTQIPNIRQDYRYGTALVLVGLVLIMNISAIIIRSKFRKKRW